MPDASSRRCASRWSLSGPTGWEIGCRAASTIPRTTVEREFRLLFDVLTEMVGPLRREANTVWFHVCEHYGRIASARGLAAGEVVEELPYLRELLIQEPGAGAGRHAGAPGHGHHAPAQPGNRQGYRGRSRRLHRRTGCHAVLPERSAGVRAPTTTSARSSARLHRLEHELQAVADISEVADRAGRCASTM